MISIMCLTLTSCERNAYKRRGKLQPEWEADMRYYGHEGTYHFGVLKLHKYDDVIIANTTFNPPDTLGRPDDRLCGIDANTGETLWFFPKNVNERHYCVFYGTAHLYKHKLVFRYFDNPYNGPNAHSTVCLDLDSQEEVWRLDGERLDIWHNENVNVVGDGQLCYFVNNNKDVYCANMESDSFEIIKRYEEYEVDNLSLTSDNNLMVFYSSSEKNESNYLIRHNHIDILDKSNYTVVFTYSLETDIIREIKREFAIQGAIEKDGVLYLWSDCYNSAIDMASGEIIWERENIYTYVPNDHILYGDILLKCAINATVAYDIHTGEIIYGEDNYGCYHASLHGKYVYLLNRDLEMDIINIETGEIVDYIQSRYHRKDDKFFGSYPTIIDDKLYIMSHSHLFRYPLYPWK